MGDCLQRKPARKNPGCGMTAAKAWGLQDPCSRFREGRSITESPQLGFLPGGFAYLWTNIFFPVTINPSKVEALLIII